MTNASEKLYQSVILDHSRSPRNFGMLESRTHMGKGVNRLCGDEVTLYLNIDRNSIVDVRFDARGCALCVASSSLMSEALKGSALNSAMGLAQVMTKNLVNEHYPETLKPLAEIWKYPARVRCVTLPWHTFLSAVNEKANKEFDIGEIS